MVNPPPPLPPTPRKIKTSTRLETLREVYEHQASLIKNLSKDVVRLRNVEEDNEERLEEINQVADEQRVSELARRRWLLVLVRFFSWCCAMQCATLDNTLLFDFFLLSALYPPIPRRKYVAVLILPVTYLLRQRSTRCSSWTFMHHFILSRIVF